MRAYFPVEEADVTEGNCSSEAREGDYQCSTQSLVETRHYDRIVSYAANSDSPYPGRPGSGAKIARGRA